MMRQFVSVALFVFVCACLLVAGERRAYAYVDPGSGLLVIQSAASVMAAVGYFFRRRIKALFGGARKEKKTEAVVETAPAEAAAKRDSRRLA